MATSHPKLQKRTEDGRTWQDILRYITGGYSIDVHPNGFHVLTGPKVVYNDTWLPEAYTNPYIAPRMAILHSQAGPKKTKWKSLWNYMFRKDISLEAHFLVELDGTIANTFPINKRADCNYRANSFRLPGNPTLYGGISFETQDEGYPTLNNTPWSPEQLRAIIAALTCISVCYGVWCTAPVRWNDSGIGHHNLFPNDWTNVKGKTCPGSARIRQMDYIRSEVATLLAAFGANTGWKCGT